MAPPGRRQDLSRGARLEIRALTADFRAECSRSLVTNTFVTNAVDLLPVS